MVTTDERLARFIEVARRIPFDPGDGPCGNCRVEIDYKRLPNGETVQSIGETILCRDCVARHAKRHGR